VTDCQPTDRKPTDRKPTDRKPTDRKPADRKPADCNRSQPTHYQRLGLQPSASTRDIRQAYRELSRRYHPDTTRLPLAIAQQQFQQLNEAYATLSRQAQRHAYDKTIGDKTIGDPTIGNVRAATVSAYPSAGYRGACARSTPPSTAGAVSSDRPLSAGELFVLLLMSLTLMGCLLLAIVVGVSRGDVALPPESAREFGFQPVVTTVMPAAANTVPDTVPDPMTLSAADMPPQDFFPDTVTSGDTP
jgi:DnaJ domain